MIGVLRGLVKSPSYATRRRGGGQDVDALLLLLLRVVAVVVGGGRVDDVAKDAGDVEIAAAEAPRARAAAAADGSYANEFPAAADGSYAPSVSAPASPAPAPAPASGQLVEQDRRSRHRRTVVVQVAFESKI
jgi:hypothetical protein